MIGLDNISDIRAFEAIARTGSLTAAAQEMDLALSVVSKRLQRLEAVLGARLIDRTTRRARLTDDGERFLADARAILDRVQGAQERIAGDRIAGRIRLAAGAAFAHRQIAPRLPAFLARHPEVRIEMETGETLLDLVDAGIDVAFRQTAPLEETELARPIAPDGRVLVASPDYLARYGTPLCPEDLSDHLCLAIGRGPRGGWRLTDGRREVVVPVDPVLIASDGVVPHQAALAGGGIAIKSSWDVLDDLEAGRLCHVLPSWHSGLRRVHAVLPMRAFRPLRVARLVDYLAAELTAAAEAARVPGLFEQGDQQRAFR